MLVPSPRNEIPKTGSLRVTELAGRGSDLPDRARRTASPALFLNVRQAGIAGGMSPDTPSSWWDKRGSRRRSLPGTAERDLPVVGTIEGGAEEGHLVGSPLW